MPFKIKAIVDKLKAKEVAANAPLQTRAAVGNGFNSKSWGSSKMPSGGNAAAAQRRRL
jgi:hypothetical protein